MSALIIHGNGAAIEEAFGTNFRRFQGGELIRSWIGPIDAVRSVAAALVTGSSAIDVTVEPLPGNALGRVRARYASINGESTEETIEETLTIAFNDTPLPINVHPSFIEISNLRIRQMTEDANNGDDPRTLVFTGNEAQYYGLLLRGETTYRVKMPVITYTRTVPYDTVESLDVSNAGYIFSLSEVAGRVAAPIVFSIPEPNVGVAAGTNYFKGYLFSSQMEFLADGRLSLIETYEFGLWSSILYSTS